MGIFMHGKMNRLGKKKEGEMNIGEYRFMNIGEGERSRGIKRKDELTFVRKVWSQDNGVRS